MKKIPRPNDILRFDGASETRTKHAMSTVFLLDGGGGVPRRQPHRRSGMANLPYVGAIP